jgi:hypothetical protein
MRDCCAREHRLDLAKAVEGDERGVDPVLTLSARAPTMRDCCAREHRVAAAKGSKSAAWPARMGPVRRNRFVDRAEVMTA